jgi:hypothetical protein
VRAASRLRPRAGAGGHFLGHPREAERAARLAAIFHDYPQPVLDRWHRRLNLCVTRINLATSRRSSSSPGVNDKGFQ